MDFATLFSSFSKEPEDYFNFDSQTNLSDFEPIYNLPDDQFRSFLIGLLVPTDSVDHVQLQLQSQSQSQSQSESQLIKSDNIEDINKTDDSGKQILAIKDAFVNLFDGLIGSISKKINPINAMIYMCISRGNLEKLRTIFEVHEQSNVKIINGPVMMKEALYSKVNYQEIIDFLLDKYIDEVIEIEYLAENKYIQSVYVFNDCIKYPIENMKYLIDRCNQLDLKIPPIYINPKGYPSYEITSGFSVEVKDDSHRDIKIYPHLGSGRSEWIEKIKFWINAKKMSNSSVMVIMNYDWLKKEAEKANYSNLIELIPYVIENEGLSYIPQPLTIKDFDFEDNKEELIKLINMAREYNIKIRINIDYPLDDIGDHSFENVMSVISY